MTCPSQEINFNFTYQFVSFALFTIDAIGMFSCNVIEE